MPRCEVIRIDATPHPSTVKVANDVRFGRMSKWGSHDIRVGGGMYSTTGRGLAWNASSIPSDTLDMMIRASMWILRIPPPHASNQQKLCLS